MARGFDAACEGQGGYAQYGYFFRGPWYMRYDWAAVQEDHGWKPLSLWGGFEATFPNGVDAALSGAGPYSGKTIFFKGGTVAVYNWESGSIEATLPLGDVFAFPAPFDQGVDAALAGRGQWAERGYFFKGAQYLAYDWTKAQVVNQNTLENWHLPAAFLNGIDAACNGAHSRADHAFFFLGDEYVRYDWSADKVDSLRPVTDMRIVAPPSAGPTLTEDPQPGGGGAIPPEADTEETAPVIVEALVLAGPSVSEDLLTGVEAAIRSAGAQIVLQLGDRAIVVGAPPAVHDMLPNIVGPPLTLFADPPTEPPAGLDEITQLYVEAWALTARGPLAEADGPRTDEGARFDLEGCVS